MTSSRRISGPHLRMAVAATVALLAVTFLLVQGSGAVRYGARVAAATTGTAADCGFQKSTSKVAFCDTFDQPAAANDSRSGPLNPTVWGVSEVMAGSGSTYDSGTNSSQNIVDSIAPVNSTAPCGGTGLTPTRNLQICDGQLFDSVNDDGGQTILAMYPRQPFDIANRTGDVTFDVSDNSQGNHAAWPSLIYTDQPVPAPYTSGSGLAAFARNSFGITFAGQCNYAGGGSQWCPDSEGNGTCTAADGVSVDSMFETVDYIESGVSWNRDGCVAKSTNPAQQNHVEVLMSKSQVQVWASNPGSTTLKEIADASVSLPLTRGLLWMEDDHYNGDKFNTQQSDTFGWDNFGFDGPILPRDLGFDVPNRDLVNPDGSEQLGWGSDLLTVKTRAGLPVTQAEIDAASAALVEFNWFPTSNSVPIVSLNGHPFISTAWPGSWAYAWRTIAVPVPLSDVVTGQNTITVEGNSGGVANFDLILAGAGGTPTCLDPSSCGAGSSSPPPTPTPTPTKAPTPTPETITKVPCTVTLQGKQQTGTCSGTFTPG